jgi:hypothetical protein
MVKNSFLLGSLKNYGGYFNCFFYFLLVTSILLVGSKNVERLPTYEGLFTIGVP